MQYKYIYIYTSTHANTRVTKWDPESVAGFKKSKTLRNHPISIAGFSLSPPWTPQPIQMQLIYIQKYIYTYTHTYKYQNPGINNITIFVNCI